MTVERSLALVGGPASGKTTYLGALVDALDTGQLEHLEHDVYPDDARALTRLAEPLLEGRYPQRTKAERHVLEAKLRTKGERFLATSFTLRIGDYDGEEVERLFQHRTSGWSEEWQKRARADHFLIFIRPQSFKPLPHLESPSPRTSQGNSSQASAPDPPTPPVRLRSASTSPLGSSDTLALGLAEEAPAPRPKHKHDPVPVPTVFELVELLQFIRHVRGLAPGERPRQGTMRIALVVSAWDSVEDRWRREGPGRYLAEHAALLEDFLWSNFPVDDVFRFGLSSTRGDLNRPQESQRYRDDPGGEVVWMEAGGRLLSSPDLSLPLCWALFGDRAFPDPT